MFLSQIMSVKLTMGAVSTFVRIHLLHLNAPVMMDML